MSDWLTLEDLTRACRVERAAIVEWVELGIVHAHGPQPEQWRFEVAELGAARSVARLARELDLAPFAAALVHDLLGERDRLERRVQLLERMLDAG
jgi:hypothetical protein